MFGSGPNTQATVKHKIFVSYHHGGDQAYYDAFSQSFHDSYDVIIELGDCDRNCGLDLDDMSLLQEAEISRLEEAHSDTGFH